MDLLSAHAASLRRQQLDALEAIAPAAFAGGRERLARGTATGLAAFARVAARAPELVGLVEQVVDAVEQDPRLTFLRAIPDGPVLSMTRAVALERAAFGIQTAEVEELSLEMGVFTILLDGLLDEAPELLSPVRPWLTGALDPSLWDPPPSPAPSVGEPLADTLVAVTVSIVAGITRQDGWRDATVREQFSQATRAAFAGEVASHGISIRGGPAAGDVRARVLGKSTAPIWAGSLLPFCVHGWPDHLEPARIRDLAFAVGEFGGWVDDVVDVVDDLRADRWSAVLLELYDCARLLGVSVQADSRDAIAMVLGSETVADRVANGGTRRLAEVERAVRHAGLDPDLLLPPLCDMASACLTDGLAVPVLP